MSEGVDLKAIIEGTDASFDAAPERIIWETLPSIVGNSDILTFAGDVFMLLLFIYTQARYGLDMMFIIIPLGLIGAYFGLYVLTPSIYVFNGNSLTIEQRYSRDKVILYSDIFNYEWKKKDNFLNVNTPNKVTVYYEKGAKKRKASIDCYPKDVSTFINTLKNNCPVFREK